ncbi:hypothetical protein Q8A67_020539 [Cirrhinus molitorella]|uniref:Uncharacterized protein n=1 Tax=Cirrhinus molitorella TaxID=172907 RepID=A0AA88P5E9_9TELE|nr:hypothetical protein Q8A67_020539 [Cirrhinus molitorella]
MKAGTGGGIIWVMLGFKALAFVCCLARSCSIRGSLNSKVGHASAPPPRKMNGPLELCPEFWPIIEPLEESIPPLHQDAQDSEPKDILASLQKLIIRIYEATSIPTPKIPATKRLKWERTLTSAVYLEIRCPEPWGPSWTNRRLKNIMLTVRATVCALA